MVLMEEQGETSIAVGLVIQDSLNESRDIGHCSGEGKGA